MRTSEQLYDLARAAHRRARQEKSLKKGAQQRQWARYMEQIVEAEAWLEERRAARSESMTGIVNT